MASFTAIFVKQKLVLITDLLPDSTKSCVWLDDFVCSKWREGAKMPRSMNKFAYAADEQRGLIYMARGYITYNSGPGYDSSANPVRSASVYNVEEDKWDVLPENGRPHKVLYSKSGLIEYDYSQDKLNIVGTFPRKDWGGFTDFAVFVSNKIFVGIRDPFEAEGFYMFAPQDQGFYTLDPPSETGGTFKLIDIERPWGLQGRAICAATLNL
ncbi:hypothetical protein SUGI_0211230 [Cryptomeria japonica]|nr:hypothetical protein SUGI_0211230 [Cryptomeria japonica]